MIDWNTQLKIQAFLDGELSEVEAREIAALITSDRDAVALHTELKNIRRALNKAEAGIRVPETREFYWSKISREIEKMDRPGPAAASPSIWHALARWLKPLGAVAAVAIVGIFAWQQTGGGSASEPMVTAYLDAGTVVYQDESSGTTFVWFSYPADSNVADEGASTGSISK